MLHDQINLEAAWYICKQLLAFTVTLIVTLLYCRVPSGQRLEGLKNAITSVLVFKGVVVIYCRGVEIRKPRTQKFWGVFLSLQDGFQMQGAHRLSV